MKTNLLIIITVMFAIGFQLKAISNAPTVKKDLTAVKTDQPPTIDGILDDACWQDAPEANGFIDERTEKLAKDQSVGRLVYTDEAIYVGLHLHDEMPDKIVARQTKDQTRFQGEDWVSFSLDPFHTHQFADRNFFYGERARHEIRTSRDRTCGEKRMDWTLENGSADCR